MKKIVMGTTIFLCIFLLTGCNNNKEVTVNCTYKATEVGNKYSLEANYVIKGKGDVAKSVSSTEIVTSDDSEILDYFEEYLNDTYENLNETYSGYIYKITRNDNQITSKVDINYNAMNIEKYIEDNTEMKKYVNSKNKLTIEGLKKIYKEMGATCK